MTKRFIISAACLVSLSALPGCLTDQHPNFNTGFAPAQNPGYGYGNNMYAGNNQGNNNIVYPIANEILQNLLVRERHVNDGLHRCEEDEYRHRLYLRNNRQLSREQRRIAEENLRLSNARLAEQRRQLALLKDERRRLEAERGRVHHAHRPKHHKHHKHDRRQIESDRRLAEQLQRDEFRFEQERLNKERKQLKHHRQTNQEQINLENARRVNERELQRMHHKQNKPHKHDRAEEKARQKQIESDRRLAEQLQQDEYRKAGLL